MNGPTTLAITVTVQDTADTLGQIDGPGTPPGAASAHASVPEGSGAVAGFTAQPASQRANGGWSLSGTDAAHFAIDASGALRFRLPPDHAAPRDADGDNTYLLTVSYLMDDGSIVTQSVTVTVTGILTAAEAVAAERETVEEAIAATETAQIAAMQDSLRGMTATARERLAGGGGCGSGQSETAQTGEDACLELDETMIDGSGTAGNLSISASNRRVLSFDGFRLLANGSFVHVEQAAAKSTAFDGRFAVESSGSDRALYGAFVGLNLSRGTVEGPAAGGSAGRTLGIGGYAVHAIGRTLFSEAYLALSHSANRLDLAARDLDLSAVYDARSVDAGWTVSGVIRRGRVEFWPEASLQVTDRTSGPVTVEGVIPGDRATVVWDGRSIRLTRSGVSTDIRYNFGAGWMVDAKPGIACEKLRAATVISSCGLTGSVGLTYDSPDTRHSLQATLGIDEASAETRRSGTLQYEFRF